jgi:hypothetical protein
MSYESGSLLSIGAGATLEQVLVLSDGRVATKLFAGKPVAQRDILNLSDWLMLADGQNVIVTPPLNKSSTPALPASPAPEPAVATPLAEPLAEPVAEVATVYPAGTMLRWIKDDQNKRVAIVMKDSVLQVKETIAGEITLNEGRCQVKRTFFKSFAEWKSSLPEGGTISIAAAKPWAPTIEEKAKAPIVATTDADYIAEVAQRYLVRSQLHQQNSIKENIERARSSLKRELDRFARNVSVEDNNINTIFCYAQNVAHYAKWLQGHLVTARGKTADELGEVSYYFKNHYKQKLFAYKGGLKYEICSKANMLALAPSAEGSRYRGKALVGETFADLGIEMKANGKPRLEVSYYRRRIEL